MYHCDIWKKDKFITLELTPEGAKIKHGKYTKVTKVNKTYKADDLTIGLVESVYHEEERVKYDILDGKRSSKKFCEFIWNKTITA